MAIITSQQLNMYYDMYRNTEITFTKEIIHTLSMDPRQIYIKCNGSQWPCIINSTSLSSAKIIIGTKSGAFQALAQPNVSPVSIKFTFYQPDGQLLTFFISGKLENLSSYMSSKDLAIATIQYTQRPPESMIEMLGHLLDANANAIRRKEERIPINAESCRKLGIPKEECVIEIQNVPRHCILRDISFSGAKVILLGLSQFLMNKQASLSLEFDEPHEVIQLQGIIIGATPVEGRKDMFAANIRFDESSITLSYKIHINNYLTSARKNELDIQAKAEQQAVQAAIAAQKKAAVQAQRAANQLRNSAMNSSMPIEGFQFNTDDSAL